MSTTQMRLQSPIEKSDVIATMPETPPVRRSACIEDPNAKLVEALKSREPQAYDSLIRAYEVKLLHSAYKITLNREDAEDAVQDTFVQVYRNIDSFRGESQFSSWLTRIAINQALMMIRKKKKRAIVSIDSTNEYGDPLYCKEIAEPGDTPEQQYLRRQLEENLIGFLTRLKKHTRPLFETYLAEGLTNREIAQRFGLSVPAVKTRLLRGKLEMRAMADRASSSKTNRKGAPTFRPRTGKIERSTT